MSIELTSPQLTELKPRIKVIGVGGAGGNAVNNMIQSELQGVDFLVANTDAQALASSLADDRIQLGVQITQGLGAGSQPRVGEAAAEEALDLIEEQLNGCHMAFITAGMGGGTGTGAAPVIARVAREKGLLTVGVVTKPFQFEGARRLATAEAGIEALGAHVDTLIIIPNQNLFRIATEKTTFADAFAMADEVLHSGVRGITDLMVMPGLINLDFADVRTVMTEMGRAMMGTGEAEGERRATEAADAAISNPLLDEVSMQGARGVIINITGGMDLTLFEVDEAANHIRSQVDPDANIIVGSAFNQSLDGLMRVSVVATGIQSDTVIRPDIVTTHRPRPSGAQVVALNSRSAVAAAIPEPLADEVEEAQTPQTPPMEPVAVHERETPVEIVHVEAVAAQPEPEPVEETVMEVAIEPVAEPVAETAAAAGVETGFSAPVEQPEPVAAPEAAVMAHPSPVGEAANESGFVPAEPMQPGETDPRTLSQPDPFAEAAFANGPQQPVQTVRQDATPPSEPVAQTPEPGRPARGLSLFERMTAGIRSGRELADEAGGGHDPAAGGQGEPGGSRPGLGGLDPADRPAPVNRAGNQLEIPSFLRRQVN